MRIERWDSFREVISLRDAMNSLLAESFVRPGGPPAPDGPATLPLDVAETEGEFVIRSSLPGVAPEDVRITVQGDTLTIRGESKTQEEKRDTRWHLRERRAGSFERALSLGSPVDADKAVAHFDLGVLTLTLPKTAGSRPMRIKVSGAQAPSPSGGRPAPTHDLAAEQAREHHEAETARNAQASNRDRMVDIGRGNQQAGRQGQ